MKSINNLLLLIILLFFISGFSQNVSLSGYVRVKNSGESFSAAKIELKDQNISTKTNDFGFYSLSLPIGNYHFVVSAPNYESQEFEIELNQNTKKNIELGELSAKDTEIKEVVISNNRVYKKSNQTEMGVEKLNILTTNKLPVILGERDVIKSLQLLPGVKSGGDGSSGFTVRGGSLDQNLILLDDAPVYNASHLLGFFSTFNSDALKDVTLYKGTAPASFGGRISSVVDIRMKDGNNQKTTYSGGIGLISSRLNIEGPIQKGKSSFLISGRRTYADVFLKASEKFKDNILYFYDLNTKFNYQFDNKNQIFVSGYFGRDELGLKDRFGINWGNATATVRFNHLVSDRLFSNTSLIYSNFDYVIDIGLSGSPFQIISQIQDFNFKQEFQFFPNPKNEWKFGVNVIHHNNNPGELKSSILQSFQNKRQGLESALYASNNWKANDQLSINYGVRLSVFSVLGGSKYYTLDANRKAIDTMEVSGVLKNYTFLEPRLALNYKPNNDQSFKLAYTRNTQHMHLISNSVSGSSGDRWIMNTNNIKPEIGDQISMGFVQNFNNSTYEFSVETYYKWMQNQIDYKDNADERDLVIEQQLLFGRGRAYGLEFLLRKNKGKFTGWVSYTLSRTQKQIDGINQNQWYAARQDRTHDISVVGIYELNKKWNFSSIFTFQTGNAVSFPTGKYQIDNQNVLLYSERNAYRMPNYHRMDIAANYVVKNTEKFRSEWSFGVFNVYAHENPYFVSFKPSETNPNQTLAIKTALFKAIPSVSWNFKF